MDNRSKRALIAGIVGLPIIFVASLFATGTLKAFQVESRSMEPTLKAGDRVIGINNFAVPDLKGRVITFHDEEDPESDIVKRVIGLKGDDIKDPDGLNRKWEIRGSEVFVAGDNHEHSYDSYEHGPIGIGSIRYLVLWRVFPFNKFGKV